MRRQSKKATPKAPVAAQRRLNFDQVAAAATSSSSSPPPPADAPAVTTASPRTRRREAQEGADGPATGAGRSPPAKKPRVVAAVTPDDADTDAASREAERLSSYVPTYIHANVGYKTAGTAALGETTLRVYQWIRQHYTIPVDLEQRRSHGPLSGSSYEERVIQEYELHKLTAKSVPSAGGKAAGRGTRGGSAVSTLPSICTFCAELGHRRNDCPALI